MRKFLPVFAILGFAAAPAMAQTAPAEPVPAPKVKTVKKTVCQRIEADRETGSRLGSTSRVCKTVEVPASEAEKNNPQGSNAKGHEAHAH